ncbi:hypothetical protein COCOR_03720 [Corallococcus coralloides DSM 2259]|uniref:Uncharacterized protein n=1 Tax=Corallococcus coralloides (strain ATCC 25202 / DSM 2259 / NBRC 100086 / M2) TaxID=1144275 RepID=H8MPQ7_CORCM|nr:hypothetical protein [Corallococcus coralloides]AFE05399.1 hypothetical protein COCOR_03720 [Corallococcus coralloides DSM 2259]
MAKGHRRNDEPDRIDETRVAPLDDDLDETDEVRTEQTQVPPAVQRDAAEAARSSAATPGRKSWGNQARTAPPTSAAPRAPEFTGLETRMTPPPVPDDDLVLETRVDGLSPPPPPPGPGAWEEEDDAAFAAPATTARPSREGEGARQGRTGEGGRPPRGGARENGQGAPEAVRPGRAVTREEGQDLPEIVRPNRGGGSRDEGQGLAENARSGRGGSREEGQGLPENARSGRGGSRDEGQGLAENARSGRGGSRDEGQGLPEIIRPSRGGAREEGQGLPEIARPPRGAGSARGGAREEGQGLPEIARLGRDGAKQGEGFELPEIIRAGRGAELDGSSSEPPRKASRPEPMIFAPLPSAQAASQSEATPELRTMFATHSALLAERLKAELQHKIYGRSPHRILRVDEPEGPSTAGGKQARQAISLVDRKGSAPALVAGWVDVAKGQASLRNHEAVAKRYEFQHGTPLELVPEEYEKFLTDVDEVLRTAAIQVRILVPDESAPTRATVGQQAPRASGLAVRWVMLLVIVAFLLGLGAGATLLRGG